VSKLVWRVKLVAELRPGVTTETEVVRIERDEQAGLAELGLQLAEAKQLTAALQAQIVPAQVAVLGGRRRSCVACQRGAWISSLVLESQLAWEGRALLALDACLAIQAEPGSPPPHPTAAAQGDKLARLRGRLASARQPGGVVHRRGGRSLGSGAAHDTGWPAVPFAAGDCDGDDLALCFILPIGKPKG